MQYDCNVNGIYSFYHKLSELSSAVYGCLELPTQIRAEICLETFRSFSLLCKLARTHLQIKDFYELIGNIENLANFLTAYILFDRPPSYKVCVNDLYCWQSGRFSLFRQDDKRDLNVMQISVISSDLLNIRWQSFDYDKCVGSICEYHFSISAPGNISVKYEPVGFIN